MNTIVKLIASENLSAAKNLVTAFPELNEDREVITTLKQKLNLIDVEVKDIGELVIEANFANVRRKYGYLATFVYAYITKDEKKVELLKKENDFQLNEKILNKNLKLLENTKRVDGRPRDVIDICETIFFLGIEDYVSEEILVENPSTFIRRLSARGKWEKIKEIYTSEDTKLFYLGLMDCVTQTGIFGILINPPEELKEIQGFSLEKMRKIIVGMLGFPFNLANTEQVYFFEDKIEKLPKKQPQRTFHNCTTFDSFIAIQHILGEKKMRDMFKSADDVEKICVSSKYKEMKRICRFLGFTNSDCALAKLRKIYNPFLYPYYRRKYLKAGGSLKELEELDKRFD